MKRLYCRLAEYYLALSEDDIENGLPMWVQRHLKTCPQCQAQVDGYRRTHEMLRQYARMLPSAPPEGWQPLQLELATRRHPFPLRQVALASAATVVVVLVGFALWFHQSASVGDMSTPPQTVQRFAHQAKRSVLPSDLHKSVAPATKGSRTKPAQPVVKPDAPSQMKPSRLPQPKPAPLRQPPRRIEIATQPTLQPAEAPHEEVPEPPSSEPLVPVQPVVSEAHPVASAPVPEGYVMQAAYPATAGAVE